MPQRKASKAIQSARAGQLKSPGKALVKGKAGPKFMGTAQRVKPPVVTGGSKAGSVLGKAVKVLGRAAAPVGVAVAGYEAGHAMGTKIGKNRAVRKQQAAVKKMTKSSFDENKAARVAKSKTFSSNPVIQRTATKMLLGDIETSMALSADEQKRRRKPRVASAPRNAKPKVATPAPRKANPTSPNANKSIRKDTGKKPAPVQEGPSRKPIKDKPRNRGYESYKEWNKITEMAEGGYVRTAKGGGSMKAKKGMKKGYGCGGKVQRAAGGGLMGHLKGMYDKEYEKTYGVPRGYKGKARKPAQANAPKASASQGQGVLGSQYDKWQKASGIVNELQNTRKQTKRYMSGGHVQHNTVGMTKHTKTHRTIK